MSSGNFSGEQFAGFANPGGVTIKSAVRTGQFITLALAKGVIFFAAIVLFLSWGEVAGPVVPRAGDAAMAPGDVIGDGINDGIDREGPDAAKRQSTSENWLPWIGIAVFVVAATAGVVAPAVMRSWAIHNFQQTCQQLPMSIDPAMPLSHDAGQLVTRLMASTLISQAIFEGAGFLNLVLLLVTGQIFLVVPALLAVFAIVVQCPRTSTMLDRLEPLARA
ncbi:MAG TPA: hypothetical protein DDZ51_20045 [Planctomycetaceae bacterium]|nr:hypothetical protein [Planctomycetaceae bacterium]